MVLHACNSSTWEAEARREDSFKFKVILNYIHGFV